MECTANDLSRTHGANSWAQHHTETSRISRGRAPRQTERRSAAGKCINAERDTLEGESFHWKEWWTQRTWLSAEVYGCRSRAASCEGPLFFSPHRHLVAETVIASKGNANKMGSTTARFPGRDPALSWSEISSSSEPRQRCVSLSQQSVDSTF